MYGGRHKSQFLVVLQPGAPWDDEDDDEDDKDDDDGMQWHWNAVAMEYSGNCML